MGHHCQLLWRSDTIISTILAHFSPHLSFPSPFVPFSIFSSLVDMFNQTHQPPKVHRRRGSLPQTHNCPLWGGYYQRRGTRPSPTTFPYPPPISHLSHYPLVKLLRGCWRGNVIGFSLCTEWGPSTTPHALPPSSLVLSPTLVSTSSDPYVTND